MNTWNKIHLITLHTVPDVCGSKKMHLKYEGNGGDGKERQEKKERKEKQEKRSKELKEKL